MCGWLSPAAARASLRNRPSSDSARRVVEVELQRLHRHRARQQRVPGFVHLAQPALRRAGPSAHSARCARWWAAARRRRRRARAGSRAPKSVTTSGMPESMRRRQRVQARRQGVRGGRQRIIRRRRHRSHGGGEFGGRRVGVLAPLEEGVAHGAAAYVPPCAPGAAKRAGLSGPLTRVSRLFRTLPERRARVAPPRPAAAACRWRTTAAGSARPAPGRSRAPASAPRGRAASCRSRSPSSTRRTPSSRPRRRRRRRAAPAPAGPGPAAPARCSRAGGWNSARRRSYSASDSGSKQASAACCASVLAQM